MENKKPAGGYRFQVLDLSLRLRQKFLSICKLKGTSGSNVIKQFMTEYVAENE